MHGFYPVGWPTKGYEWTEAIKSMTESKFPIWWFRHNWTECPETISEILYSYLDSLKRNNNNLEELIVVGHSSGGLIVADLAEKWNSNFKLSVHCIAAGLNRYRDRLRYCSVQGKDEYVFGSNVDFIQWRTSKKVDGIFKNFDIDPQEVVLKNGDYVLLPEVWNEKRLGHNLSIQLVMDQLSKQFNLF